MYFEVCRPKYETFTTRTHNSPIPERTAVDCPQNVGGVQLARSAARSGQKSRERLVRHPEVRVAR